MEKGDSSTAAGIVRLGREAHMSSPSRSGVQSPGEATVAGIAPCVSLWQASGYSLSDLHLLHSVTSVLEIS